MTVRGIEAIKLYIPPSAGKFDANVKEEKDRTLETNNSIEINTMTSVERYRYR